MNQKNRKKNKATQKKFLNFKDHENGYIAKVI